MSLQVSLQAQLTSGPSDSSTSGQFPSGTDVIPFSLAQDPKSYSVRTGTQQASVQSPLAYVALSGIGAGQSVTQAQLLYLRTNTAMNVRVTRTDPTNPVATITFVARPQGLLFVEASVDSPITLVEVEGAGTVEFAAFGNV